MLHFSLLFGGLLFLFVFASRQSLFSEYNTPKSVFVLSMFVMGFLSAFKASTVGNDTPEYIRIFETVDELLCIGTRYELGYIYLNYFLSHISTNSQILFIVTSVFMFSVFGWFIWKHSKMPWLSIMIFFSYSLFSFSMSGLRQSIAIAILFIGIDFLLRKKSVGFVLSVIAASSFHFSAILFLPVILLRWLKINSTMIMFALFIGVICVLFFDGILTYVLGRVTLYDSYIGGMYFKGDTRLASIMSLCIVFFTFFFCYNNYKEMEFSMDEQESEKNEFFLKIYLIAVVLNVLCLKVNIIDRLALYYSVFAIIILPNHIYYSAEHRQKNITIFSLFLFFLISSLILVYRPNWNSVYPYKFCWEEIGGMHILR